MNIEEGYFIDEVKERASKAGSHWFDADTMRCFSSRVSDLSWKVNNQDIYFISSEADRHPIKHSGSKRAYTIRKCSIDGDIDTISDFQEFATLYQARKAVKTLLKGQSDQ